MQVDVLTLAVTTAVTGTVGWMVKTLLDWLRNYATESRAWRTSMDGKLAIINESLVCVMRGDLIHKAHRYIDDRGYATIEEKDSWHEEWTQYQAVCPKNGFIDALAEQVMALPEHPNETKESS